MQALAEWDSFYVIVGSAAGALIGLQFVVMTLIAENPPKGIEEAGAAFTTPTVIHFSAVLLLSALVRVAWESVIAASVAWGTLGLCGLAYSVTISYRMRRQSTYEPVFEDWLFHALLPLAAYLVLLASALMVTPLTRDALFGVGATALLLLFVGIHNAWDAVAYHVGKKAQDMFAGNNETRKRGKR